MFGCQALAVTTLVAIGEIWIMPARLLILLSAALACGLAAAASADDTPLDRLWDAARMEEISDITTNVNSQTAEELAQMVFGTSSPAGWEAEVGRLYDANRVNDALRTVVAREMPVDLMPDVISFLTTEPGLSLLESEVQTLEYFYDPANADAVCFCTEDLWAQDADRMLLITRLYDAQGMVDRTAAMVIDSQVALLAALSEGGATVAEMPAADIERLLRGEEDVIRQSIRSFALVYGHTAYANMSDADLETYIAFYQTPAGMAWNAATFAAFYEIGVSFSRDVGTVAAAFAATEDL
jgi:hypothetical protein